MDAEVNAMHPQNWPGMAESMAGFPFPALKPTREYRTRAHEEDPKVLILQGEGGQWGKTSFYVQRRLIGSTFGAVFHGIKGQCPDPNNPRSFQTEERFDVAIKSSSLASLRRPSRENVFREIAVMRYLASAPENSRGHHFVMPLMEACISDTTVYLITPLCTGGDLLKQVTPGQGMTEKNARRWFAQILLGLGYIHSMGICHRDFSPENAVITGCGSASVVMDFGMIKTMPRNADGTLPLLEDEEPYGKARYMAPEIYDRQAYDGRQADIWSVGVSLLVCVAGDYPWERPILVSAERRGHFYSDNYHYGDLAFHGCREMLVRMDLMERISEDVVDLLSQILVVNREDRPFSAENLTGHPFFTNSQTA